MNLRQTITVFVMIFIITCSCQNNKTGLSSKKAKEDSLRIAKIAENLFNPNVDSVKIDSLNQHKTTLKFEKELFDFGEVKEGTILEKKVLYTNTGRNSLVIFSAFGSCGCTIPSFSKEPLAPGATDTITVSFNSTGRSGNQSKAVKVFANTEPSFNEFKFTVIVK